MSRLTLIRYGALILVRDILIPSGGLFFVTYGLITGTLEPWHLPLIAGMLGTPLVARGASPPEELPVPRADSGSGGQ
jgi:hypothetical protein